MSAAGTPRLAADRSIISVGAMHIVCPEFRDRVAPIFSALPTENMRVSALEVWGLFTAGFQRAQEAAINQP